VTAWAQALVNCIRNLNRKQWKLPHPLDLSSTPADVDRHPSEAQRKENVDRFLKLLETMQQHISEEAAAAREGGRGGQGDDGMELPPAGKELLRLWRTGADHADVRPSFSSSIDNDGCRAVVLPGAIRALRERYAPPRLRGLPRAEKINIAKPRCNGTFRYDHLVGFFPSDLSHLE
jgi:hypothetical protein